MKQATQRPRITAKTKSKINFFAKVMAVITAAVKDDRKINKNNVYAQYGISIGAPIFTPSRSKFKGYMRDESYKRKHK